MSEHVYKFNVTMSCSGCSGAIDRVLKKLDGMSTLKFRFPSSTFSTTLKRVLCLLSTSPPNYHDPAGVKSHNISLESQTAEVVAADSLDYDTVLNTIKKTGKKVNSGEADGQTKSVE